MKALTLHQPHAYLVGLGPKVFETRSWKTDFRGLLAIHASGDCRKNCDGLIVDPYIIGDSESGLPKIVSPFDRYIPSDYHFIFGELNNGGIEALVVVEDCEPAPNVASRLKRQQSNFVCGSPDYRRFEEMLAFGDFSPGRWAWKLRLEFAVHGRRCGVVRGHQGLWNVPAKVEEELLAAYREVTGGQICRLCGCTTEHVQKGLRAWAKPFLCTSCAIQQKTP